MNKDLYIELLEKKVSDLETALVTVSDKLIETEQVKKKVQSDHNELYGKYCNMKGHYDNALETTQIIVDKVNECESNLWLRKVESERDSMSEELKKTYLDEWASVYRLKRDIEEYYESKVG